MLLELEVRGFWAMAGRAARLGLAPWGGGGLGLEGPAVEEEAVRTLEAPSGRVSAPRGRGFSGELTAPASVPLGPPGDLLSCGGGLAVPLLSVLSGLDDGS